MRWGINGYLSNNIKLPYELNISVFNKKQLHAPLNIQNWSHICPYLKDVSIEIGYSLIIKEQIDVLNGFS